MRKKTAQTVRREKRLMSPKTVWKMFHCPYITCNKNNKMIKCKSTPSFSFTSFFSSLSFFSHEAEGWVGRETKNSSLHIFTRMKLNGNFLLFFLTFSPRCFFSFLFGRKWNVISLFMEMKFIFFFYFFLCLSRGCNREHEDGMGWNQIRW